MSGLGKNRPQGHIAMVGVGTVAVAAIVTSQILKLLRRQKWFYKIGNWPTFGTYKYPITPRRSVVETLHGVKIKDPYRWLEDPTNVEVAAWVDAQNTCTDSYFANLVGDKHKFCQRMTDLYNYDKYSCVWHKGGRYFFWKKAGLQNQSVLYTMDTLTSEPRVLIDPNTLRDDGTAFVGEVFMSEDGNKAAYMVSLSGSDWKSIYVKDVATGKQLPDEINWCKFSNVAWTKDGKGFFYARYQAPSTGGKDDGAGTEVEAAAGQKVYYHQLGWTAEQDVLFYETPETPQYLFGVEVSDDGQTLLLTMHDSCDPVNRLFYFDLRAFDGKDVKTIGRVVKLVDDFNKKMDYITNSGRTFYFYTNQNAPRYKIVSVKLPEPGAAAETDAKELAKLHYTDVVGEDGAAVLEGVYVTAKKYLLLKYLRDVTHELQICTLDGKDTQQIDLPGKGQLESVCTDRDREELFYKYTSFNDPGTVFKASVKVKPGAPLSIDSKVHFRVNIPGLNPDDFETKQEFYRSKDGTNVPMFITRAKNAPAEPAPTFLDGYGGFSISLKPGFNLARLLFIKHFGGVGVVANIRGGQEYGESWHEAGTKQRKQNVFDDFIAAAEHLISTNVTRPDLLAINGGSNGGLLVAACINQRPELFAAAVAQVGVLDMLRFHKFTIGYAWCSDYGNADTNVEDFRTLVRYSPVHNVDHKAIYPATLITTGDHDDRVVPLHSYKYIAALQHGAAEHPGQTKPLLIRVDTKSGHGAGKPTSKVIEEQSDVYVFVAANTGAKWRD